MYEIYVKIIYLVMIQKRADLYQKMMVDDVYDLIMTSSIKIKPFGTLLNYSVTKRAMQTLTITKFYTINNKRAQSKFKI